MPVFDTRGFLVDGLRVVAELCRCTSEDVAQRLGLLSTTAAPTLPWVSQRLSVVEQIAEECVRCGGMAPSGLTNDELERLIRPQLPEFLLPHQRRVVAAMLLQEMVATNIAMFEHMGPHHTISALTQSIWYTPNLPYNSSGGVVWGRPGTGKTILTLGIAVATGVRTLCVVPAGLVKQWESEARRFNVPCCCLYGNQRDDGSLVVITSYETLVKRRAVPMCERLVCDEATERSSESNIVQLLNTAEFSRRWVLTASILGKKDSFDALATIDDLLACTPVHNPVSRVSVGTIVDAVPADSTVAEQLRYLSTGTRHRAAKHYLKRLGFPRHRCPVLGRLSTVIQYSDHVPVQSEAQCVRVGIQQDTHNVFTARRWWGWSRNLRVIPLLRLGLNFEFTSDQIIDRLRALRPDDLRQFTDGRSVQMQPMRCSSVEEMVSQLVQVGDNTDAYYRTQVSLLGHDDELCAICLEHIPRHDAVMTQCGHIMHRECAQRSLRATGQCWCRFRLRAGPSLFALAENVAPEVSVSSAEVQSASRLESTLTPTAKLVRVLEHSSDLLTRDVPHLVFCETPLTARFIQRQLAQLFPGRVASLDSDVPIWRKQRLMGEFQSGAFDCLVLTYRAGGVGVNFQRARSVILADAPMYEQQYQQAVGRVIRYGQSEQAVEIALYTVDGTMEQLLPWPNDTFDWSDVSFGFYHDQ